MSYPPLALAIAAAEKRSAAKDVYRREAESAQRPTSVVAVVRMARKRIAGRYARKKLSISFQTHE
jgi:hypothetical protein